jgi:surface protein
MFQNDFSFNQPLTNLVDTSGVASCAMNNMFQNVTLFNQDIGGWNVSKVTNMTSMFNGARQFNNGGSDSIKNWSAPLCRTFSSMFQSDFSFNQPLTNLVNTSGVSDCSLNLMFDSATSFNQNLNSWNTSNVKNMASMFSGTSSALTTTRFNNGETGLESILNVNPALATFNNSTKVLLCPGASFTTLTTNDVLIIQASANIYSNKITSISSDTSLVISSLNVSNLNNQGSITSINKQIAGTTPLNWNTSSVTNMSNMFQFNLFFNQDISRFGSTWDTSLVTNMSSMFLGFDSTSRITLFNNGQIITGTTAPMGWTFNNVDTLNFTNYRLNCRLTNANRPALLP